MEESDTPHRFIGKIFNRQQNTTMHFILDENNGIIHCFRELDSPRPAKCLILSGCEFPAKPSNL